MLNPSVLRRFDRWLLLRAPMLWRTRLLQFMLLLIPLLLPIILSMRDGIDHPEDFPNSIWLTWISQVSFSLLAIGLWVRVILRKPVGEISLHRHLVTVVAVATGSYLWLVAPTLLAYSEIRAIALAAPSDQQLEGELGLLGRYRDWRCVPDGVSEDELQSLREVLTRYYYSYPDVDMVPSTARAECEEEGRRQLKAYWSVLTSKERIKAIMDTRRFWDEDYSDNEFAEIRASFTQFVVGAFGIGVITALLSYPPYVWRRTVLRR